MKHCVFLIFILVILIETASSRIPYFVEVRPPDFNISYVSYYDKLIPPKHDDVPARAHAQICPWKIGKISFVRMNIEIDVYVVIKWNDHRLNITPSLTEDSIVSLRKEEMDMLWAPILSFRNGFSDGALYDSDDAGLLGYKWDREYFKILVRKTDYFHCDFDLHNYPMDVQQCRIEVQAANYKNTLMLEPMPCYYEGLMSGSDPPEFTVFDIVEGICTRKDKLSRLFSCVEYRFQLRRQITRHLLFTYFPSMLIVILTFVSFWLECSNAAPRVAISLTSLLTLTTQFGTVQKDLPPVAYVKAIDVWMFVCMFIVFGGLIEFAFANYFDHHFAKQKSASPKTTNKFPGQNLSFHPNPVPLFPHSRVQVKVDNVIDRVSRVAFPIAFLLFNVVYWSYYS